MSGVGGLVVAGDCGGWPDGGPVARWWPQQGPQIGRRRRTEWRGRQGKGPGKNFFGGVRGEGVTGLCVRKREWGLNLCN